MDLEKTNLSLLPDCVLLEKNLSDDQIESIPLEKRIKILKDFSRPVKFGRLYWHILSLSKNEILMISEDTLIEDVKFNDISMRLRSFFDENFSEAEKESIIGRKLFCLDDTQIENYLDYSQRNIGRHWWVKNSYYSEKRDKNRKEDLICINSEGKRSVFYWDAPLSIRPAVEVAIPYVEQDKHWNSVWEKAAISKFNFRGAWTAVKSKLEEKVDLYPHYGSPTTSDKVTETVEIIPLIDVTGM